jgi:hypothetical protein
MLAIADKILTFYNFERISTQPVPNAADATIYRMVGRYRGLVGEDGTLYRR